MKFIETDIPGVIIIEPRIFGDHRGFFTEVYRASLFAENGIPTKFVQDNLSRSKKGTLRGLHYQIRNSQAKLVMATRGTVIDVAVDIRKGSPTFGKHIKVELSEENKRMVYIPEGFAHGFAVVSEIADFQYKCSNYYDPESERAILWNDPTLNIDWGISEPLISEKDKNAPALKDVSEKDFPALNY